MSTRATYKITDYSSCKETPTYFYIHYDGYPEGAAGYFNNMMEADNLRGGFAVRFLRENELAEFTEDHECHGDTEYRYNFDGVTFVGLKRSDRFECEGFEVFFRGSIEEFLDKYLQESDDEEE
jgi:hypothetical protein